MQGLRSGIAAPDSGAQGHVEFVFLFAGDTEAEPPIEAQSWIDFCNVELQWEICLCGFGDYAADYFSADALPLRRTNNVQLAEEEAVGLDGRLEPSDIRAVEHNDADFRNLPLFGETHFVRRAIEAQSVEDPRVFREVQPPAEFEVGRSGGAQVDLHRAL
ncbi:MAG TPA: hypothetical protein VMD92_04375 [Acidobacteriaceae bacterium]|nr:hypothetical protein [Acidobacteriaceae bacterium]